jgi:hypothetical protein
MKIVDKKTFLRFPKFTLYAVVCDNCFGAPRIKLETCTIYDLEPDDFFLLRINNCIKAEQITGDAKKTRYSVAFNANLKERENRFSGKCEYAVWEDEDIDKLIEMLNKCKSTAKLEKDDEQGTV